MYVQRTKPWSYTNAQKPLSYPIQFHAAEAIRIAGIMAQPFMPIKASEMLDMIGVAEIRRGLEWATFARDYNYGKSFENTPLYLFPRLEKPPMHPETEEELEAIRASRRAAKKEWRTNHFISVGRDPETGLPVEQLVTGDTVEETMTVGQGERENIPVEQPVVQEEEEKTGISV